MVCLGSTFLQDAADLGNTQRNSKQQQQRQQQRRWRRRRRRVMSFRLKWLYQGPAFYRVALVKGFPGD